ncbi:MAG: YfbU family protein [Muribaculaceae bacterium]|nr:YfbU family protein [Muribaculaceae bacterium]
MDNFNSHINMGGKYDRMLEIWDSFDNLCRYKMNEATITKLLEA